MSKKVHSTSIVEPTGTSPRVKIKDKSLSSCLITIHIIQNNHNLLSNLVSWAPNLYSFETIFERNRNYLKLWSDENKESWNFSTESWEQVNIINTLKKSHLLPVHGKSPIQSS